MPSELTEEPVGRREFETFKKLLDDKKSNWDKELDAVKADVKELRELTTSVSELAQSIKAMVKEQERMAREQERTSGRLDAIEKRDGEKWRKTMSYIATTVVGLILGFLFTFLTKGGV